MQNDPGEPISLRPPSWASLLRATHQRPPNPRLGRFTVAGAALPAALAIGLWLTGQPGDERMGPWGLILLPLFFLLLALATLLSGLSDLRPTADHRGMVLLRLLSTALRIASFAVWGISVVSLFVA
jgi:hypothetical protein